VNDVPCIESGLVAKWLRRGVFSTFTEHAAACAQTVVGCATAIIGPMRSWRGGKAESWFAIHFKNCWQVNIRCNLVDIGGNNGGSSR